MQIQDSKKYIIESPRTLKDYVRIVNKNRKIFLAISLTIFIAAIAYALYSPNIYESTATLRVTKQPDNLLQQGAGNTTINVLDRYISNEIGVITNYNTRARVAKSLMNKIKTTDLNSLSLLVEKDKSTGTAALKSTDDIAYILKVKVKVEQEPDMDAIDITALSPSPMEAALIANTYAEEYQKINLEENQGQLGQVESFLEKQSSDKLAELDSAENVLADFKEKGRVVALDAQSTALIDQLSQLEAQKNAAKLDLMSSNQALDQYRQVISKQSPELVNYMENQTSQAYISALQKQIADLQMNRDLALANNDPNIDVSGKVKEYNQQIKDLEQKLNSRINEIKTGAYASSPDQIKDQSEKLMAEEVRNRSLKIRVNELDALINSYNSQLTSLPKESMQLSQYERNVQSLQELYSQIRQKYQEVKINELSKTGNVVILSEGRVPDKPVKPIRALIALIGLLGGTASALGFILIKDYFTEGDKNPNYRYLPEEEMQALPPAPQPKRLNSSSQAMNEPLMLQQPQAGRREPLRLKKENTVTAAENKNREQMILISSAMHGEGKTSMAVNMAVKSAQSNQNTLLIDCDIRLPMVHKVLNSFQTPGLSDYLMERASFQDIVRRNSEGVYYITAGTTIQEPNGLLSSSKMEHFLYEVRDLFDFIVIISTPVVTEEGTEILSKFVDGIILVISPNKTDMRTMASALNLIKSMKAPLLGTTYNNVFSSREIKNSDRYNNQAHAYSQLKQNSKWK